MSEVTTKVLEVLEPSITVETAAKFDPKDFFQTKDNLYVWSDFRERILSTAESTEADTKFDLTSYRLLENANDAKIEGALPEKHLFSESEVCAVIAGLILKQPNGEKGALLTDGWWNLFYTASYVVGVRWRSGSRRWIVFAWGRYGFTWSSCYRVFSPATVS